MTGHSNGIYCENMMMDRCNIMGCVNMFGGYNMMGCGNMMGGYNTMNGGNMTNDGNMIHESMSNWEP